MVNWVVPESYSIHDITDMHFSRHLHSCLDRACCGFKDFGDVEKLRPSPSSLSTTLDRLDLTAISFRIFLSCHFVATENPTKHGEHTYHT
jgi:hypothetical protein